MNRFRDWMQNFMRGRHGTDDLNRLLFFVSMIFLIVSMFTKNYVHYGFLAVAVLIIGYSYFRTFSRNLAARYKENQWYLQKTAKIRTALSRWVWNLKQSREYKIFKCPDCGQKLRIPRGKGKIEIRCRKCSKQFIGRS